MKIQRRNKKEINKKNLCLRVFVCVCSLLMTMAGCVREPMEDCSIYTVRVRAVDAQGNDITQSGAVTSVDIYLFDNTGFVRMVPKGTSTDFLFGSDIHIPYTLVAWGNIKQDSIKLADIRKGTPIHQASLELMEHAKGFDMPSTDLFYSRQDVKALTRQVVEKDITLVLERCVAALSVQTHLLINRYGHSTEPYFLVVRGTASTFNFLCQPNEKRPGCAPRVEKDITGDLLARPFRVFPTREDRSLTIDIYRGKELLLSVDRDSRGEPIKVAAGKHTHVDIDFESTDLVVTVIVDNWDEVDQDTQVRKRKT